MSKRCFKCGELKPLEAFYAHRKMADGHLNKCKDCTKSDVHRWYQATRDERSDYEHSRNSDPVRKANRAEYQRAARLRNPEKARARQAVCNAIRDGRLSRKPCDICGTTDRVQAHHHDYSKPLEVRWLCFTHHREAEHGQVVIRESRPS